VTAYFAGWWEKEATTQRFKCELFLHAQYQETQTNNPYSVKELELTGSSCYNKGEDWGSAEFSIDAFALRFFGPLRTDATQSELAIKEARLFPNVLYDVKNKEHHRMMEAEPVGSRA
jgi:hypothetical protein